jgi:hypothetical protein
MAQSRLHLASQSVQAGSNPLKSLDAKAPQGPFDAGQAPAPAQEPAARRNAARSPASLYVSQARPLSSLLFLRPLLECPVLSTERFRFLDDAPESFW